MYQKKKKEKKQCPPLCIPIYLKIPNKRNKKATRRENKIKGQIEMKVL
jgi:hypothetical protein